MAEEPRNRRAFALRMGTLVVVAAALAAVASWLRGVGDDAAAKPLNPNDAMAIWRMANPPAKRATAQGLVAEMQREGKLGPQTGRRAQVPVESHALVDALVAALDASTDRNRAEYVSPGTSIATVAERAALQMGWNQ